VGAPARLGPFYQQEQTAMSFLDKAKNKLQQVQGQVKTKAGERTGNRKLQAEGKADTVKATSKTPERTSKTA